MIFNRRIIWVPLAAAVLFGSACSGMFIMGAKQGYDYALHEVAQAVTIATYPTVYISYPSKTAVAIEHQGVCVPFPRHLPAYYHVVYVSPEWQPCSSTSTPSTTPSPALAAIMNEVQK